MQEYEFGRDVGLRLRAAVTAARTKYIRACQEAETAVATKAAELHNTERFLIGLGAHTKTGDAIFRACEIALEKARTVYRQESDAARAEYDAKWQEWYLANGGEALQALAVKNAEAWRHDLEN